MPGLLPGAAQAQVTAPNATLVQFKFLYYKDYQESGDRMTVKSPALYLLTPIADDWVFEIGAVYDSISGASPYYHTTLSGASGKGIQDGRTAADVTVTKYFANRTSVAIRAAYSNENDYRSTAGGVTIRHATPDQNTTFTLGGGYSGDEVFPDRRNANDRRLRKAYLRRDRRRVAGVVAERHRAAELLLRAPERLPDGPLQSLLGRRQPPDQARPERPAGALEPLLRVGRRDSAHIVSLLPR